MPVALSARSLPEAQLCPPPASYPVPPSDTALRVCVIGSGAAGSAATKACLEGGVLPTCLEQQDSSGGIWRFDTSAGAPSSVYRSTVINTSKELSAFSDFPVAEAAPTYMHHQYMLRYIQAYRRHFGLDAYTRYRTRVVDVRQVRRDSLTEEERNALPDAELSGASPHSFEFVWRVESETVSESPDAHTDAAVGSVAAIDSASGVGVGRTRAPVRRVEHFHGLMVCTGHHSTPHQVRFPNQEAFQGRILHSHDYKDERPFLGQRVCVVGVGNSGVDIAVELSRHCSHTVLSTRSGVWIFPRLGLGGRPLDHVLVTRWMQYAVPAWIKGWLLETLCRLLSGDMSEVGLTPLHRLLSAHQTTNAELVPRIRTGMLRVHRDIVRFTPQGAVFADQPEVEEKLDAVVLATGYDIALPFLRSEPRLLNAVLQDDNRWTAYKFVFPLDSQYHSAAFIGFMQPQGATNPIVEMQSRWYVSVLTGATSLPSSAAMQRHARREQQRIAARFTDRSRHRMQVDYLPYMDELGAEIGAVPSPLGQLLHLRPRLAWNLLFGPAVPAQFRLQGPHPWPHAANFITHAPYPARRVVADTLRRALWTGLLLIGAASAIAAGIFMATTRQN